MKIAILGTRGIPNNHGGFEQFAEYFSVCLAEKGHEIYVYNSHNHPYQEKTFKGVHIIHCLDPEYKLGTAGQFIYDLNCIRDSRKGNFDIVLQLGYTSSSIWHWLMPKKALVVTNMDGLEWKRTKYSPMVRKFLKYAERLGALHSDYLIADSTGIQDHLKASYNRVSEFIPYGAQVFSDVNPEALSKYRIQEWNFSMVIARLEPENNIETIIKGYIASSTKYPLLIFGGLNFYGLGLMKAYVNDERVQFLGANYCIDELNNLRHHSRYYFHGHTVGGTNPSLLEAMASNALIIAHDNVFNKSILNNEAIYFSKKEEITEILDKDEYYSSKNSFTKLNQQKIENSYSWNIINGKYEKFFLDILKQ